MFIYLLYNKINGKLYVGQTTRNCPNSRFKEHVKASRSEHQRKRMVISSAIFKHGWNNFGRFVIDTCETYEELNNLEKYWINRLNCLSPNGYNLRTGGSDSRFSEESRAKLSLALKGRPKSAETKAKIAEAAKTSEAAASHRALLALSRLGTKASDETRAKMSLTRTGMTNSPAARAKMSVIKSGCGNAMSKFTEEQIAEIRAMYKSGGITQEKIGNLFNTTQGIISRIVNNVSYKPTLTGPLSVSEPCLEVTLEEQ